MDQRGHGRSPRGLDLDYGAAAFARDVGRLTESLGSTVHLVGHSMGARIAIVAAARWPTLFRSVAVIDIGPEASAANIRDTVRGLSARPERFESRKEALAFAFRNRAPTPTEERIFLARLESGPEGALTWRSPVAALSAIVTKQRSRDYWRDWRRLRIPTLYVHGGASNEVSRRIYARMQAANQTATFEEYEGVGHNIPLIAPERLARTLERHWTGKVGRA
jgi:pimeloyl-ACP methyl ester carboxylesterase